MIASSPLLGSCRAVDCRLYKPYCCGVCLSQCIRALYHGFTVAEFLFQKLEDFEGANRSLRRILQEQHASETAQERLSEQKGILINKFAACEEENEHLKQEIKVRLSLFPC